MCIVYLFQAMTSFGWKRKAGSSVSKSKSKEFEENSKDEDLSKLHSGEIDWLHLAPTKKGFSLEDAATKSKRLQSEGETLAEAERFWEAITKWDDALLLMPKNHKIFEMKAQAYMHVGEPFLAVASAEKALEISATWWLGYQTLGRAQLAVGEVTMAIKSFSRALHINPANEDLWGEDLQWAVELRNKHRNMKASEKSEKTSNLVIEDVTDAEETEDIKKLVKVRQRVDTTLLLPVVDSIDKDEKLENVPANMVKLRD